MSEIKAGRTLSGSLSCAGGLTGALSARPGTGTYSGDYEVIPQAFAAQTLNTAGKLLRRDIVVAAVPYYETSNKQDGLTVYIAEEAKKNG